MSLGFAARTEVAPMPKTMLVADDSLTIRKVIGMIFATEDFQVTAVDNGTDAIARARELRPDVVLADVSMPGKSGYEVAEALKSDPSTAAIPVLLLAGTFEPFDEARARASRADAHISKPFESQALIDRVRSLANAPDLRTTEAAPAADAAPAAEPAARPVTAVPPPPPPPAGPGANPFASSPVPAPAGLRPGFPAAPGAVPAPPGAPRQTQTGLPRPMPGQQRPTGTFPAMGQPMPGQQRPTGQFPGMPQPMPGQQRPTGQFPGMQQRGAPPGMQRPTGQYAGAPGQPMPGQQRPDPFGLGARPMQQPMPGQPQPQPRGPMAPGAADGGEAVLRDALSRASREVIEKIAWEVVPQLAETIIREELERLIKDRQTEH